MGADHVISEARKIVVSFLDDVRDPATDVLQLWVSELMVEALVRLYYQLLVAAPPAPVLLKGDYRRDGVDIDGW